VGQREFYVKEEMYCNVMVNRGILKMNNCILSLGMDDLARALVMMGLRLMIETLHCCALITSLNGLDCLSSSSSCTASICVTCCAVDRLTHLFLHHRFSSALEDFWKSQSAPSRMSWQLARHTRWLSSLCCPDWVLEFLVAKLGCSMRRCFR
jgi:hypothetical protein